MTRAPDRNPARRMRRDGGNVGRTKSSGPRASGRQDFHPPLRKGNAMPSRPSPKAGVYVSGVEERLIIDLTAPKEHRKLLKRVLKAAEASDAAGAGSSSAHSES